MLIKDKIKNKQIFDYFPLAGKTRPSDKSIESQFTRNAHHKPRDFGETHGISHLNGGRSTRVVLTPSILILPPDVLRTLLGFWLRSVGPFTLLKHQKSWDDDKLTIVHEILAH